MPPFLSVVREEAEWNLPSHHLGSRRPSSSSVGKSQACVGQHCSQKCLAMSRNTTTGDLLERLQLLDLLKVDQTCGWLVAGRRCSRWTPVEHCHFLVG